jgi:lysyl-tRNA synthetase class 2
MKSNTWSPVCDLYTWKQRLDLTHKVRSFFVEHPALEVETPSLSRAMGTDPHLDYLATRSFVDGKTTDHGIPLYLCTSPEFHLKRLLAAGWGDIWQLCKAFRSGESGPRHNPEFSILEWYRAGWDWNQLMDEVALICATLAEGLPSNGANLARKASQRITWRDAYQMHCGLNATTCTVDEMQGASIRLGVPSLQEATREEWLDYLMVSVIEPKLGKSGPEFLTHYPASQAALAQTETDATGFHWARRFEMYLDGIELCNGYQELVDAVEQSHRFEVDLAMRKALGKRIPDMDTRFLSALDHGMPACSGVAVGFDRLVMLLLGKETIQEVLAFPMDIA